MKIYIKFIITIYFLQTLNLHAQDLQTTKHNGKQYYIFPYKNSQYSNYGKNSCVIPSLPGNWPDGDYIMYYEDYIAGETVYDEMYNHLKKKARKAKKQTYVLDTTPRIYTIYTLKNSLKEGKAIFYSTDRALTDSGYYINDQRVGYWYNIEPRVHSDGYENIQVKRWRGGENVGMRRINHNKKKKSKYPEEERKILYDTFVTKCQIVNEKYQGPMTEYLSTSWQVMKKLNYESGTLYGLQIEYYSNGKVSKQYEINEDTSIVWQYIDEKRIDNDNGISLEQTEKFHNSKYYEYGHKNSYFEDIPSSSSTTTGIYYVYYPNGQLIFDLKLKGGQQPLDDTSFYSNGNISTIIQFKKRFKNNIWQKVLLHDTLGKILSELELCNLKIIGFENQSKDISIYKSMKQYRSKPISATDSLQLIATITNFDGDSNVMYTHVPTNSTLYVVYKNGVLKSDFKIGDSFESHEEKMWDIDNISYYGDLRIHQHSHLSKNGGNTSGLETLTRNIANPLNPTFQNIHYEYKGQKIDNKIVEQWYIQLPYKPTPPMVQVSDGGISIQYDMLDLLFSTNTMDYYRNNYSHWDGNNSYINFDNLIFNAGANRFEEILQFTEGIVLKQQVAERILPYKNGKLDGKVQTRGLFDSEISELNYKDGVMDGVVWSKRYNKPKHIFKVLRIAKKVMKKKQFAGKVSKRDRRKIFAMLAKRRKVISLQSGNYKNGKLEGLSKSISNNINNKKLNQKAFTHYSNGLKNGEYLQLQNGDTLTHGYYINDLKSGRWIDIKNENSYYGKHENIDYNTGEEIKKPKKKNIIKEITNYTEGIMNGEYIKLRNKDTLSHGFYVNEIKNGLWITHQTTYGANASHDEVEYINYINDKYSGPYKKLYSRDTLLMEALFKEDAVIGLVTKYYYTGKVKSIIESTNDTFNQYYDRFDPPNQKFKYFYPSGNIAAQGFQINNQIDSNYSFYHENGKIALEANIKKWDIIDSSKPDTTAKIQMPDSAKAIEMESLAVPDTAATEYSDDMMTKDEITFNDDYYKRVEDSIKMAQDMSDPMERGGHRGTYIMQDCIIKVIIYDINGNKHIEGYQTDCYINSDNDCGLDIALPKFDIKVVNAWDETGKQTVKNGTGHLKQYDEQSRLICEGDLKDSIEVGMWKYFAKNGNLSEMGKYLDGVKDGLWISGDISGFKNFDSQCFNTPEAMREAMMKNAVLNYEERMYQNGESLYSNRINLSK